MGDIISSCKIIFSYLDEREKCSDINKEKVSSIRSKDILLNHYLERLIDSLLIRFRIFFDQNKHNPISFVNLLQILKKNSYHFSKEYYFKQCSSSTLPMNITKKWSEEWYDEKFPNGLTERIDQDKKYIRNKTKDIDLYINKRIAHLDTINTPQIEMTIENLIGLAEELIERFNIYYTLLTGTSCPHQQVNTCFEPILLKSYFEKS